MCAEWKWCGSGCGRHAPYWFSDPPTATALMNIHETTFEMVIIIIVIYNNNNNNNNIIIIIYIYIIKMTTKKKKINIYIYK